MKFLNESFSKSEKKEAPENVMKITEIIGPSIDGMVNEIFMSYKKELLAESITYIVPAVWGAKKDGELTPTQKEMNDKIAPVVNQVFEAFEFNYLNGSQEFAMRFIIRGLIISKIAFMLEGVKNRTSDMLKHQEPLGNA